jgi:hypothetical protein
MPIKPEMREFYPSDWSQISRRVRFERAAGICQGCGRPHGVTVRCLLDGRWFDAARHTPIIVGAVAGATPLLFEPTEENCLEIVYTPVWSDRDLLPEPLTLGLRHINRELELRVGRAPYKEFRMKIISSWSFWLCSIGNDSFIDRHQPTKSH